MCSALADKVCLPFLLNAQNKDGGWGFHAGSASRAEPTAWALVALTQYAGSSAHDEAASRACHFLELAQLPDGSWPSSPDQKEGSWATSLACFALLHRKESRGNVARGVGWLSNELPREAHWFPRLLRRLAARRLGSLNESYYGWCWTVGTASWVEPTSYAILFLRASPPEMLSAAAKRRVQIGEAMLRDRMCPGGGWDCGNPMIYGVPGDPLVIPTVWALLALRGESERTENVLSLDWLEKNLESIQGPGSLALARICIEAYGHKWPASAPRLRDVYGKNEFLHNIPVIAWACLASATGKHWLANASRENPR